MDSTNIIKRIRDEREKQNLKQEYMAHRLHISQNAYSKIEIGQTKLTVDRLFQLAEVLDVPAINLLDIPKV
jgi:transcriptional regulator with XRE-family HTH domain